MRLLLSAELLKLVKQSKTYYALGSIMVIETLILITAYFQGSTILDLLLDNLKQSFYFEGSLLNGNLIMYIVLNSLWFNVPLILMIVTSGIVTDEYKDGTMQTVMLQAVDKWKFILSKYIIAVLFTLLVIGFMMLSTFILSYSIFGTGDLVVYLNTLNFFEAEDAFHRICWAFASGALTMVFYCVASLTLAIFIKEAAKTWIAAAVFLIITTLLLKVDFVVPLINTYFFPKLIDTWQQLFYYQLDWNQIFINNAILILYTIAFAAAGTYVFHKKDIG
ncbi:ABC-2 type transport system permease protein [Pedobacter westerhofensis]|uniref:ABC-2 type transport system permease protein n=1 Tax=Pedobacter westerhofensis TaxID=425512 RepID=A0A521FRV9_9SPHI|nr:ABC transporter permease subunit [Pedobacter westerhofensis]SMO98221.1 ABC-2 type transport system permease protein [Pedobacter westerhofensis]